MRSLRTRLIVTLVGVLVVALGALAFVVDAVVGRALERQFTSRLGDDAAAVAGMAEDEGGVTEFEYEPIPTFETQREPAYFQLWLDDGTVVARSPSLGTGELARRAQGAGPRFEAVVLPDGRPGQAVQLRQPLRIEDDATATNARPRESRRSVTVVVARGTGELIEVRKSMRRWLALLASLALAGASAAAVLAVSRSLRSTRLLSAEIEARGSAGLDRPLSLGDLPSELHPLIVTLNEMLERLAASFAHEKRFTADVSHELRTPLAALRATLEVTASRARTSAEYLSAIAEASGIVQRLQALCENLLALARFDAGPFAVRRQEVGLHALVEDGWRPLAALARQRGLAFVNEVDPRTSFVSDGEHLGVILANLLANAVSYTTTGGTIRIRGGGGAPDAVFFEVADSGPSIPAHVLPHVFERFFRGDPARTDGVHCGIGLALAQGIAHALGLEITARNDADGGVTFRVAQR
jgi:two-component system, OmpR family, sensor kinase